MAQQRLHQPRLVLVRKSSMATIDTGSKSSQTSKSSSPRSSPKSSRPLHRSSSMTNISSASRPLMERKLSSMNLNVQAANTHKEPQDPDEGMSLDLSEGSGVSEVTDFTASTAGTGATSNCRGNTEKSGVLRRPSLSSLKSFRSRSKSRGVGNEEIRGKSNNGCSAPSRHMKRVSFSDEVDMEGSGTAKKRSFLKRRVVRRASTDVSSDCNSYIPLIDETEPLNDTSCCPSQVFSMPDITDEGSNELADRYCSRSGPKRSNLRTPTKGPTGAIPPRASTKNSSIANGHMSDLQILGETAKAIISALRIGAYLGTKFHIDHVQFTPRGCVWNVLCRVNQKQIEGDIESFQFPAKVTCCENEQHENDKSHKTKYTVEISLADSIGEDLWEENYKDIKKAAEWLKSRVQLYICQKLVRPFAPEVLVKLPQPPLQTTQVHKCNLSGAEEVLPASRFSMLYPTPASSLFRKSKSAVEIKDLVQEEKKLAEAVAEKKNEDPTAEEDIEIMFPTPKSMLSKRKPASCGGSISSKSAMSTMSLPIIPYFGAGTTREETFSKSPNIDTVPDALGISCESLSDESSCCPEQFARQKSDPCKSMHQGNVVTSNTDMIVAAKSREQWTLPLVPILILAWVVFVYSVSDELSELSQNDLIGYLYR